MKKISLTIFFASCFTFLCAQNIGDFQSAATGNWNVVTTWQTWNGTAWVAPAGTPNNTNGVITIQAGHTVTIPAAVTVDEAIVNGTMNTSAGIILTIFNGAGVDLQINGTFGDMSTSSISWNAGATWQMGASGTLIKTTASSSNLWQSSYQGGIATIPSTSNWILRKTGTAQPALSTTTPGTGSVYPNLTIENNTGTAWVTPLGSSFTGSTISATIKGNLDVGGSGTNTVSFQSTNTYVNPVVVNGNVLIRAGNTLRNFGTGLDIQGNLTVSGTISYDANDGRKLIFSGGNAQNISGTGTLNVWDCTLNKSGNSVTLNRVMTIDNLMTFTGGIINTTTANLLIFASTATVTGANNTSFANGPVQYFGTTAFTFPIGKNADYQALSIGTYTPTSGPFWTETFTNGCTTGCPGSAYVGSNGAWTITNGANGTSPNDWFVSCAENGMPAGSCGAACGSNQTLHIANTASTTLACFFCPAGDCGAAYDANGPGGFACSFCPVTCNNTVTTDKRAESPVINCTGKTGITLSFNYIEGGQTTLDNATVWYFDGAVWAQIDDPPKVVLCSGQGTWTARTITLPASADNNPNVKIGFRWVNNEDGAGADPSFAVDEIKLATAVESFTAEYFYANPQVVYNNNLAPTLSYIDACEYWVLNRLPAASTAATNVTLTWDANSCPAIPQVSDTRVAHFDLVTWQDEGNGGNTGTTAAGTVVSAAPVTYFSPFTIGFIPITPLPIEMIRFDGACAENYVSLKWATATETDNDFFTVERSVDGISFAAVGNVNGAGNSSQLLSYEFSDTDPFSGANYYRIKQTDFNGHYSYSKIIVVDTKNCGNQNLQLVHTFFNADDLEIDYTHANGIVTIEVYNAEGKLIYSSQDAAVNSAHHINVAGWSKSLYFIRISDGLNSVSRTVLR